jgi:uncharacterized membrane protein
MTGDRLRLAATTLAAAGAAIAAYLSYTRLSAVSLMCPTSGCETVQRSAQSKLAGIPVAYLGLVAYLLIASAALSRRRSALRISVALVAVGVAFSGYLLVVQLAIIGAVCVWCAGSDAVMLALAIVTVARALRDRVGAPR